MIVSEQINTKELFIALDKVWNAFMDGITCLTEQQMNAVPFKDSWTVAQLATHIKKSNRAIAQGLQMNGIPNNRNAEQRIEELRNTFLNYDIKFQSPDFIIPEKKEYKKEDVIKQLDNSIEQLRQLRSVTNLPEIINLPVFGEITKLEILYFVLYHTQRHLRQLKNMMSFIR